MPKTLKELRRFLGLSGYYRHFIPHYAGIAAPLTDLMVEGIPFDMTREDLLSAFSELKERLVSADVL